MLNKKSVLITGGTGSFGKKCAETILRRYEPERLIILSRDELKQSEMSQALSPKDYPCLRYFLGDVRDKDRLYRAFDGVDVVIHAAALKQVPTAEYNPFEAIKTNILGAENVINASIDRGVKKVVALSTDKAANPINLYGATKLCSDKLFIAGNVYSGWHRTKFSVVRYGNVIGSRGSVVPYFKKLRRSGVIPITDPAMTRFFLTIDRGVEFVLESIGKMKGGELFVPKIPSVRITDLAEAIAPECRREIVGIRPGEKLHEVMITDDETQDTFEFDDHFIIEPKLPFWTCGKSAETGGKRVNRGFRYASDTNDRWLTIDELRRLTGDEGVTERTGAVRNARV